MVNNHCKLNQSLTIQTFIFKIFLKENTQLCKPAETHMKVIQMSSYIKFEGQHIPAHPHPKPCCLTFDRRRSIKTGRQKEKLFLVFFFLQYHSKENFKLRIHCKSLLPCIPTTAMVICLWVESCLFQGHTVVFQTLMFFSYNHHS